MASISKRGPFQFQAIVRRVGHLTQTRTFETEREARDWAGEVEADMRRNRYRDDREHAKTTLGDLLVRYQEEVTSRKKKSTQPPERSRIRRLLRHPLAQRRLPELRKADFIKYMYERGDEVLDPETGRKVSSKTVREELLLLSAVLNKAIDDWEILVVNHVANIRNKPKPSKPRDRRPSPEEEQALFTECQESGKSDLDCAIRLAIGTGMRCGEIAPLIWRQVDFKRRTISLETSKNGDGRQVPMSKAVEDMLRSRASLDGSKPILAFRNSDHLSHAFADLCRTLGIQDLRFHDLRHEAASRFAPHMKLLQLMKIMGWKRPEMAARYYNPTVEDLVATVRRVEAERKYQFAA